MAEAALVERDIKYGEQVVRALDDEPDESGMRPTAALWLYFPEEERWRLLLALPAMEREEPQAVYRRLIDVVNRRVPGEISVDNVGLAPPALPLVRLLGAAIQTEPDAVMGIRFTNNVINGQLIDDAYIYRLTTPEAHSRIDPEAT